MGFSSALSHVLIIFLVISFASLQPRFEPLGTYTVHTYSQTATAVSTRTSPPELARISASITKVSAYTL